MNGKNDIIITENGAYIDGVPPLKWGEHKDCTYAGAVAAALNTLGKNATYEQISGLAGSCFHFSMCYGWDPGSTLVNTSYHFLRLDCDPNATRAFGIDYQMPGGQDKEAYGEKARQSIDAGVPVLALGSRDHPEWCVVTGYEKKGGEYVYFGRSYFDVNAPESELYTDNRHTLANNFPGEYPDVFFRLLDPCEPMPAKEALRISLQTCLDMFEPHEKMGYGAYEYVINSLDTNVINSEFDGKPRLNAVGIIFGYLLSARRTAHIYLTESAEILSGGNREKLLVAAGLYKEMHDALEHVTPYEKLGKDEFNFEAGLSPELRKELSGAFRTMLDLEKRAHTIIAEILTDWDNP
ncbi:MAG: C39 family peptidase [Kiritimatiellaeota bacterium]|nr:C39 family peptidase [Kiritimatiellota bacterium]